MGVYRNKQDLKSKYPLLFRRKKEKEKSKKILYKKAWSEAKKGARLLKDNFGAQQIFIFGSLIDESRFHLQSDIDIAEKGIPDEKFFAAVGAITRYIEDFDVDLVDIDKCRESIRKSIKREGVEI